MGSENLRAAMAHPGVAVAAVCDVYQPNLERAAALARRDGQRPKEVRDFREILADKSIDAVCISAPDHWHPYMTVEACKAGKDVYVEKPACVAVEEGAVMVAAARKYKRVVQAGTWQRSGQHFQKACQMVRDGTLGKVAFVRSWIYGNQPRSGIGNPPDSAPPAGLDWNLWQGPRRRARSTRTDSAFTQTPIVLPLLLGLRGRADHGLGRAHDRHRANGLRRPDATRGRRARRQVLVRGRYRNTRHAPGHVRVSGIHRFVGSQVEQHRGAARPPDGHYVPRHERHTVRRSPAHPFDAGEGLAGSNHSR